jgi:hypothetical protein
MKIQDTLSKFAKKNEKTEQVGVRIEASLFKKWEKKLKDAKVSKTDWFRAAIMSYLDEENES